MQDLQLAYEPAGDGTLVVKHKDGNVPDSAATRIQVRKRHQLFTLQCGTGSIKRLDHCLLTCGKCMICIEGGCC